MVRAAKGSVIILTVMVISFILNYLFNISFAWLLGPDEYGIYGVSVAILSILGIFG